MEDRVRSLELTLKSISAKPGKLASWKSRTQSRPKGRFCFAQALLKELSSFVFAAHWEEAIGSEPDL
jgi:hypothetical protein